MQMLVRVHMVECRPLRECLELRPDLCPKFASNSRHKEEPNAARVIFGSNSLCRDEAGNLVSWQNGRP